MKAAFKIQVLFLALALCFFLTVPGPVSALEEVHTIGTMEAGPGQNNGTFLIPSSFGQLKSLTVVLLNGIEKPRDRANSNPGSKHVGPKSVFINSPKTRVSSATVIVNEETVFIPRDFNAQVITLTKTFSEVDPNLREVNVFAEVNGDKDSVLTIEAVGVFEVQSRIRVIWYLDRDGDGYGGMIPSPRPGYLDSPPPSWPDGSTWVTLGGDCLDSDPNIYPGNGCR